MHDIVPIDYEYLRLIWWLLLGVLLIGFAVMDGFDLGVGALLPFVAKTDEERRIVINVVGPVWEGNQVWLILGGGAVFAAFPLLYAVSFSGLYLAMMVILIALILRPVGFKYRSKIGDPGWRSKWDMVLCFAGIVPALILGVAVGNVLLGLPFEFDDTMRVFYRGNFFQLLTPFALLAGLVSLSMLVMHGAALLTWKTSGPIADRARTFGRFAALAAIVLFALAGVWVTYGIGGHVLTSVVDPNGPSNPLGKTASVVTGGWLANYTTYSWMILAPILGFVGTALAWVGFTARKPAITFITSAIGILGIIATAGVSLFPFLLPSSISPNAGLTIWDASSSKLTLWIMLLVTCFFMPIILAYTAWVYRVMRGKVTGDSMAKNPNAY
ncbi:MULTISPECIES: cytochrome d ubiquinol oxidase subunit II [Kaistia]|uniref:Cytochrome d ubiquinol oxidase subunit II n=1 Tax=Kaistia nematophila TaxID=2994654 RepID=A0A9X3ILM5_9HYPH|nr:cytochrome d ubiquinol oxidase subunit II [Kaistia nematophila]MBN9025676.1 cytochrome d ubiquinol oxidase subunit II [Hyphomicrobiales bacterium]MCX5570678.1 cytochrome d ubiquinol oxidase subunit II [Kaistia nematophila]